jgi:hypothetical protein
MDDEERFRLVADALRDAGFDAISEQTGGGVFNLLVKPNEEAKRFFVFHTLDEEWKGAAYDGEDDLREGSGVDDIPVLNEGEPVPSDSDDIAMVAEAIASAVHWNQ